jgi:hypothetical protein
MRRATTGDYCDSTAPASPDAAPFSFPRLIVESLRGSPPAAPLLKRRAARSCAVLLASWRARRAPARPSSFSGLGWRPAAAAAVLLALALGGQGLAAPTTRRQHADLQAVVRRAHPREREVSRRGRAAGAAAEAGQRQQGRRLQRRR